MHVVVTSQLLRFQVLIVAQPSGKPVSLEENVAMISEGTTGLVTWEAALYLAEWALENTHVFTGRSLSHTKVHHAGQCVGSKKIFLFLSIHLANVFLPLTRLLIQSRFLFLLLLILFAFFPPSVHSH